MRPALGERVQKLPHQDFLVAGLKLLAQAVQLLPGTNTMADSPGVTQRFFEDARKEGFYFTSIYFRGKTQNEWIACSFRSNWQKYSEYGNEDNSLLNIPRFVRRTSRKCFGRESSTLAISARTANQKQSDEKQIRLGHFFMRAIFWKPVLEDKKT